MSVPPPSADDTEGAGSAGTCPADAELAAFSRGGLDPERRRSVARHALRCPECKDVIASVAEHLEQLAGRRRAAPAPRWAAIAAGILLTVVGGWAGYGWWRSHDAARTDIDDLVRAVGERRLIEGRLAGGFRWAPMTELRGRSDGAPGSDETTRGSDRWELAGVAGAIRRASEADGPAGDVHALGVAYLLLGSVDESIPLLERAAETASADAAVRSDLAAALIERGRRPEHADDLVRGLDVAERALGLAPKLAIARFNKALALEALGLREAAIQAWQDYLDVDPESEWSREARSRRERLQAVPVGRSWAEDAADFGAACAAGDAVTLEALFRRHPQQASEHLMSELGRWAELALAGDAGAGAALDAVERGAETMTRIVGDPLVEDAVAEIRSAAGDRERGRRLAQAHREVRRGRAALDEARAGDAFRLLTVAAERFGAMGSRYGDLAELSRLSSTYYLGDSRKFLPQLAALARKSPGETRSIVAARARWLEGLTLGVSGRPFESVSALADSSARLESLGFASDAAFVRSIEATMWWTLGQASRAWRTHREVFLQIDAMTDPRRIQAMVAQAANEAELEGHPFAALALYEAALPFSKRHDSAMDRCDGHIWHARAALHAGRESLGRRVAQEARAALEGVTDASFRARLEAELLLVEGRLVLEADPSRAIDAADRAAKWFESVAKENQLLEAYRLRAHARDRAGDAGGASKDYALALETAERQRDRLDDSTLRASFFDTAWDLARDVVGFELERGDPVRALALADRIRATSLAPSAIPRATRQRGPVQTLLGRLGPGQAVVFFSVLQDRTIAWVLRSGAVESTEIKVAEHDLGWAVESWRRAMIAGPPIEAARRSARLFDLLVEPLRTKLEGADRIVIVPDGCLHRLSWGALRDARASRFWIDDVAVAVAPSLRSLLGGDARPSDPATRVLVVGDPEFDRRLYPDLPALPGAAREAREIGSLYPHAIVLTGGGATADRMLFEVPRAQVLHVAAHALSNSVDPDLSTIVLAPGGAIAPGGSLTAREIRGRDMANLALVVLAACRSGDGRLSRMEGPLSLARPFLENGARAVVVSLWELPDEGGATFMRSLHGGLRGGAEPIDALRRAARECWAAPAPDSRICGGLQLIFNQPIGG